MRKLATIREIGEIHSIPGKDRIVQAFVDGWSIIVKKDEFRTGDMCVFIEIDSVLPEKPQFEFLRKNNFRIKTMKMAGVLSQGIVFPMSILPGGTIYFKNQDVTELLGITQYEATMDKEPVYKYFPETPKKKYPWWLMRFKWFRKLVLPEKVKGFPDFIKKTDEERIQNMPWVLNDKKTKWVATEKIDGQSGTFALVRHKSKLPFAKDKFEFIVCSRNLRRGASPDGSSYWNVAVKYEIEKQLKRMIGKDLPWAAIQGECIGPGIQGNKYKVDDYDLFVFNILLPDANGNATRMSSVMAKAFAEQMGMKHVPIIEQDVTLPDTVQETLDYAHGTSKLYDTLREGIVFRSSDGLRSFKAVDPLFLIAHNE